MCPLAWAKDIHALNCDFPAWPRELDDGEAERGLDNDQRVLSSPFLELDTPQYSGRVREEWIVERLLAQGGIRFAGILNGIFVQEEDTT